MTYTMALTRKEIETIEQALSCFMERTDDPHDQAVYNRFHRLVYNKPTE